MCTTYTWLAYQWPERERQGERGRVDPPAHPPVLHLPRLPAAVPMPCIHEEDEVADDEAVRRVPRRRHARHWVGLAIVGVQMAAWCLVGALLMHRGVTNLRRRDAALLRAAAAADILPAAATTTSTSAPPSWTLLGTGPEDEVLGEEVEATTVDADVDDFDEDDFPEDSFRDVLRKSWSSYVPMRPSPGLVAPREDAPLPPPAPPGRVVGTGAATAVVMVTVGGVMLVVGPAFMAIKIMDVYQRQRRLSKLSQKDDPPPSYDEVAEKAPRYSALFQVLENGELSALPLAGAVESPEQAVEDSASAPAAAATAATAAVEECGVQDDDGEEEPDASTPLRHEEGARPRQGDRTRRKSV
ncbi:Autophagy-related protein 14 [Frankliniella fusca]|uniref:Autophagy-related protein 14 n=1 Tax=Frankliniella fusca TaxID=407009 RepID=A0AAE1HIK5_9NEOP|nr:Autophagy-related protein 14 [Frankliniella fusca]